MKSIDQLNYSLEINETINNIDSTSSLFFKEYIPEKSTKKNLLFKVKHAITKIQPSHWFDGVWDDLSVKL